MEQHHVADVVESMCFPLPCDRRRGETWGLDAHAAMIAAVLPSANLGWNLEIRRGVTPGPQKARHEQKTDDTPHGATT